MVGVTIGTKVSPETKAELIGRAGAEGKTVNQVLGELVSSYLGKTPSSIDAIVSDEVDAVFSNSENRARLKRVVGDMLNEIVAKQVNATVLEMKRKEESGDYITTEGFERWARGEASPEEAGEIEGAIGALVKEQIKRRAKMPEAEKAGFELPDVSVEELEELAKEPEVGKCPGCGVDVEKKADVQTCWSCGEKLEWVDEEPAKRGGNWKWLVGGFIALGVLLWALGALGRRRY